MRKRLSVIIPTIRARFMARVLDGLVSQDLDANQDLEIVVVENGDSSEVTAELVASLSRQSPDHCRLGYEYRENSGANAARNFGARRATGQLLAFLDDDCIPSPGWARSVFRAHEQHPAAGCIGGQVDLEFLEPPPRWLQGPFRTNLAEVSPPAGSECVVDLTQREKGHVVSANLTCRSDAYQAIGGFRTLGAETEDPRSYTNDEVLFLDGARERGDPGILLDSRIAAVHLIPPERTTVESFENKQYRQGVFDYRYWLHRRDFDSTVPRFSSDAEALCNTILLEKFLEVRVHIEMVGAQGVKGQALREFTSHYLRCRVAYLNGFSECLRRGEPLRELTNPR